jgi:4-oxalomesaconate tautomerase
MNKTRGGASKAPFFEESGLPSDVATRDKVPLAIMGSPDKGQTDATDSSRGLMRRET